LQSTCDVLRGCGVAATALVTTLLLTACGADRVVSNADEIAHHTLGLNLATAVECLSAVAPDLGADMEPATIVETVQPCGGTTFFNHDDETIRTVDELASVHGTIVVSGTLSDDRLVLELVTSGSGVSEVGVSRARALVTTCWQVAVDLRARELGEIGPAPCNDAVVERENPTQTIPFDDVDPTTSD
jgi:hypothetical protein